MPTFRATEFQGAVMWNNQILKLGKVFNGNLRHAQLLKVINCSASSQRKDEYFILPLYLLQSTSPPGTSTRRRQASLHRNATLHIHRSVPFME
jgi:hypothetical protein